jgi:hypothetical protein
MCPSVQLGFQIKFCELNNTGLATREGKENSVGCEHGTAGWRSNVNCLPALIRCGGLKLVLETATLNKQEETPNVRIILMT